MKENIQVFSDKTRILLVWSISDLLRDLEIKIIINNIYLKIWQGLPKQQLN